MTFYVAEQPFPNIIWCLRSGAKVMSPVKFRVQTCLMSRASQLSQPMGKTEFSNTTKTRTNFVSKVRKINLHGHNSIKIQLNGTK